MPGLTSRSQLALAENARQHGEWRREGVPEVAGVRVGARIQEQARRTKHGRLGDRWIVAGIGQVVQRLPPVGTSLPAGRRGIALEDTAQRRNVTGYRRHIDVPLADLGVLGQQRSPFDPLGRTDVFVAEASQAQEPVGEIAGFAGRPAGREAAVSLDDLDVTLEARPTGKAVASRDNQLGGAKAERLAR
ncbi:MAG: hypothetical protein QOF81_3072 [Acidimicrobiaceae bacterium]|nr:hypothetical protein [Acidimicrobiaceae bacterium]